jgi:multimeric flavodoxin WrbA
MDIILRSLRLERGKTIKVIAINGSPRKKWNTATLLEKALEGAVSEGAETEMIHLYNLNFKGCISCFACKLKDGKSYGKCAMKDELTPVLEKLRDTDAVILGSPIYLGNCTGEMRSFMEPLYISISRLLCKTTNVVSEKYPYWLHLYYEHQGGPL